MESGRESLISSTGAALLLQTAQVSGLRAGLLRQLVPWRAARSIHDPGKTVLDLALAIALGGDCLADVALVAQAQPGLFGAVASDPTISRLIDALGEDSAAAVAAIRRARAAARERVWQWRCPVAANDKVIIDLDATLIGAHSEKEGATPNFKRGFGFHPMLAFVDHGVGGTGSRWRRCCDRVVPMPATPQTRSPCSTPRWPSCPRLFVHGCWCAGTPGRGSRISCGTSTTWACPTRWASTVANRSWTRWRRCPVRLGGRHSMPDGRRRDSAQVAELTRWLPATFVGWPPGMRVIARRERPHPGAQLRITDTHGWRITLFATNTVGGRLADLQMRHRLRARAEDRIRTLKDTGLTNLPLQAFGKNEIWLELAALAHELLTWTQLLARPHHPARNWEPKGLRLRLLSVAARIITSGRRKILRLNRRWPWSDLLISGQRNLNALS